MNARTKARNAETGEITLKALEYEMALIGVCIVDPNQLRLHGHSVAPEHFIANDFHGEIWAILNDMHSAGITIDALTVRQHLKAAGVYGEKITPSAFAEYITSAEAVVAHAGYYARQVRDHAEKIKLAKIGQQIAVDAFDSIQPASDIAMEARAKLDSIGVCDDHHAKSIGELATDLVAELESQSKKGKPSVIIKFGLPTLDRVVGGISEPDICIVAARPGCGKTTLGMQVALNAAREGLGVYFLSLEMSALELVARVVCGMTNVNQHSIRTNSLSQSDRREIVNAAGELQELGVFIRDPARATIDQIGGWLRLHKAARKPLGLVVIDYLQLVKPGKRNRDKDDWAQIASICEELKAIAKELQVPVLALAQLNRQADDAEEPKISHLGRSSGIEQIASQVVLIHRFYEEVTTTAEPERKFRLLIPKNRHGEEGRLDVEFDGKRFSEPKPEITYAEFA